MADIRVRMVLLGLVLGVVVAVIVAAQGCGGDRGGKRRFHGGGGAPPATASGGSATTAAGGSGGVAAPGSSSSASGSRGSAAGSQTPRQPTRRADPSGPFFGFARGRITRVDPPHSRLVALTFDDGPGPQTMQILATLRRMHAPATFFVVGSMAAIRPDVVRAEARAGMQIGNHTWSHPSMPSLQVAAQRTEIERTNAILRQLTGRRPRYFRPPDWHMDAATARVVRRERMIGVLRTADTRDWALPGTRAIIRTALHVQPGGIVAMHDAGGYTRTQTVDAVPSIVRGLRRRHLRLVTISELYAGRA